MRSSSCSFSCNNAFNVLSLLVLVSQRRKYRFPSCSSWTSTKESTRERSSACRAVRARQREKADDTRRFERSCDTVSSLARMSMTRSVQPRRAVRSMRYQRRCKLKLFLMNFGIRTWSIADCTACTVAVSLILLLAPFRHIFNASLIVCLRRSSTQVTAFFSFIFLCQVCRHLRCSKKSCAT